MKIYCVNTKEYIEANGGENLLSLAERMAPQLGFKPISAWVNNKNESLRYEVYSPKQVEFLAATTHAGMRVYIRSLCMMLYKAVADLWPGTRLRIEHSISNGYFCRLFKGEKVSEESVERLRNHMHELVERDIIFRRHEGPTKDVVEIFRKEGLNDKVRLLTTNHELYTVYYELDGVFDSYYGPLAPSTGMLRVFDLRLYKGGFLLMGPSESDSSIPAEPVVRDKLYRAFTDHLAFNRIIGVRNVGELNLSVERGESNTLINVAEALHIKYITRIAHDIAERYRQGGARIVMVAGPSSSGKTTFTKRLAVQLLTNMLRPQMISLDDYFIDREHTPRDASGDYDFESLYALDLETFNRDLNRLLAGEEVELPYYNFEMGTRQYRGNRIRLTDNSVLLIEGIHGLNPELTSGVAPDQQYRVYVSALTTLAIDDHNWVSTTDNRLLRRILRDRAYRGVPALETLRRWHSVRRGEERWIFPFQENADAMFNSSLLFELSVMKDSLLPILRQVPHDTPQYADASRLAAMLDYFASIPPKMIPPTSLLREFLGGSSFRY